MPTFKSKYNYDEIVFLITDMEQHPRQITSVAFRTGGTVVYCLACGITESWHYESELSNNRCISTQLGLH
jgi:hypothetical protein